MIIVLFSAERRDDMNLEEYQACNQRMRELVRQMPGFISRKRFVADDGEALSIFRFESEEALEAWRNFPEHVEAQRKGRTQFFASYWAQVCTVIREYQFQRDSTA